MKIKAIYPGTFDPITAGHEDLVKRASNIFESVIVAVAYNTQKNTLFSYDERYDMCRKVLSKYKNVDVIKIILPTITDLVVAAVTYPVVISNGEIGADRTS